MYGKVMSEAIRQAVRFFTRGGGSRELARGADKVLKVATKVVRKGGK